MKATNKNKALRDVDMIDSNEALAYQYGRDAGYDDGYEDGAVMFAKYLKQHSCFYDLDNYHSFDAIDIDNLDDLIKKILDKKEYI